MEYVEELVNKFRLADYGVSFIVLVLSAGIGIFYGCFGSRQRTTEEFLMADRQMSAFPVACSLVCSFVSAITLLDNPAEIYLYGTQYGLIVLSFLPLTLTVGYFYAPVFMELQVGSVYEYLELRFSKGTRVFISLLSILHLVVYMAVVVYGPCLVLERVTGINTRFSTSLIFIVCIFYSSIGGLKAIIWTNTLQALIMLVSLAVVVGKGISDVGGFDVVWQRAENSNRIDFFNFDPDPRTRHTFWTATVGGFFMWLPMYAATQQQIQRYLSLPTLASCRRALLMNMIGLLLVTALWFLAGLMIYAHYFDCDPVKSKMITRPDQLLPQFVMETLSGTTGLPGLFVAGVACASLSSVSSALGAVTSIVTCDYLQHLAPYVSDERLSTISKFVSIIFGLLSFSCIFLAEIVGGLMPAASALLGIIVGPTLGLFTLGMFCPWSNTKGVNLGVVTAFVIMICQAMGNYFVNLDQLLPDQTLFLTTEGCPFNLTESKDYPPVNWKNHDDDGLLIQVLSMSYIWQPALAVILTVLFGFFFSLIFLLFDSERPTVRSDLMSPPIYSFLNKLMPNHLAHFVVPPDETLVLLKCQDIPMSFKLMIRGYYFLTVPILDSKSKHVILQEGTFV